MFFSSLGPDRWKPHLETLWALQAADQSIYRNVWNHVLANCFMNYYMFHILLSIKNDFFQGTLQHLLQGGFLSFVFLSLNMMDGNCFV